MNDYMKMFIEYELGILKTMCRNLMDDLDAGYDYFSDNCRYQRDAIDRRRLVFENNLRDLKRMPESDAQEWCQSRLKSLGAID